jgi:hypothetical protein
MKGIILSLSNNERNDPFLFTQGVFMKKTVITTAVAFVAVLGLAPFLTAAGNHDAAHHDCAEHSSVAMAKDKKCPDCKGKGSIKSDETCQDCWGSGKGDRTKLGNASKVGLISGKCLPCNGKGTKKVQRACFRCDGSGRVSK